MKDTDIRLTPDWIAKVVREFAAPRALLDVCTQPDNPMGAASFYTETQDGLARVWCTSLLSKSDACWWCNPPFSCIGPWVDKAVMEARHGAEGLLLSRSDNRTRWWQKLAQNADARCHITRSVAFLKPKDGGGYEPMAGDFYAYQISYFGPRRRRFARMFEHLGEVVHSLGPLEDLDA